VHAFYPGVSEICGNIDFDAEHWVSQKTRSGYGKYNLFSVAFHELGHALGIFHSTEKDSVMAPFYKHRFSTKNIHEMLGESDKKLIQQMYGKPQTVEMRAVLNTKKAKVMIRLKKL